MNWDVPTTNGWLVGRRFPPKGDTHVMRQLRLVSLLFVLIYCVAFGPGKAAASSKNSSSANEHRVGNKIVRFARNLLGVRYEYGGTSPRSGFDCSGFVRFVYRHFGVDLPHNSWGQADLGNHVSRSALKPGDLVFFDGEGHVGLYIGNGRFIHAPHLGTRVSVSSLNYGWYASTYDGARRIVGLMSDTLKARLEITKLPAHVHGAARYGRLRDRLHRSLPQHKSKTELGLDMAGTLLLARRQSSRQRVAFARSSPLA